MQRTVELFLTAAETSQSITTNTATIDSFREQFRYLTEPIVESIAPTKRDTDRSIDHFELVRRVSESVEEWPHLSPTVNGLAENLNVSERTLRSAFKEYMGIPPYRYLVARRITHARTLLLHSAPDEITVQEAASQVGFWDLGRFAARYRSLFGEVPSETLKTKPPSS